MKGIIMLVIFIFFVMSYTVDEEYPEDKIKYYHHEKTNKNGRCKVNKKHQEAIKETKKNIKNNFRICQELYSDEIFLTKRKINE